MSGLSEGSRLGRILAPALLSGLLLSACGAAAASPVTNPKTQGVLLEASRSTQQERSFAISGEEKVSSSDGYTTVKESGYVYETGSDPASARARLTSQSDSTSSHGIITSAELVIGNDLYAGIPSNEVGFTTLNGATWIESRATSSSATLGDVLGLVDSTRPGSFLTTIAHRTHADVSTVGQVVIDGHETTEYSASIPAASLLEPTTSSGNGDALKKELAALNFDGPIQVKLWIGTRGLLRQEVMELGFTPKGQGSSTDTSIGITLKVNVSQYGATFPLVSAPTSGVISVSTYESDIETEAARDN